MLSDAQLIVALEGPSDSGKSTLAEAVRSSLNTPVLVLPCYVDVARSAQLPKPCAPDVETQLLGLAFYLDLDSQRLREADASGPRGVVLADRCWLSLLAHVYAVERLGGPAAFARGRELIQRRAKSLLQPQLTLTLSVDPDRRRHRMDGRDQEEWFTCPKYNQELDQFLAQQAPLMAPGTVLAIDGNRAIDGVRDLAVHAIESRLAKGAR